MTATTAATITDTQIERFEQEAGEAGDLEAVAICRRAIAGDDSARAEVAGWIAEGEAMDDGDDLVDADGDCR